METPLNTAQVIQIKPTGRFFCGFGKNNLLKTAWSLAGSKMYLPHEHHIVKDLEKLDAKGLEYDVVTVIIK